MQELHSALQRVFQSGRKIKSDSEHTSQETTKPKRIVFPFETAAFIRDPLDCILTVQRNAAEKGDRQTPPHCTMKLFNCGWLEIMGEKIKSASFIF